MTDDLQAYADYLDREPECRCTTTDRGTDTLGCPEHDSGNVQWALDHPDGEISDDEALAMCEYSAERRGRRRWPRGRVPGRLR